MQSSYWTCEHPSVCECATTLSEKRHPALNGEPVKVKKETDRNVGNRSPLSTGCQAEADTAAVDVAVDEAADAEDADAAEVKATEAMAPQAVRACAAHSVLISLTTVPGMRQTKCAHPGTRSASMSEPSTGTTSPTNSRIKGSL